MTEEEIRKFNEENYEYFDVPGAGKIQISKEPNSSTGRAIGLNSTYEIKIRNWIYRKDKIFF